MTRMKFMNTEVDSLNMPEVLDRIDKLIQIKKNSYVVTPNVDHIVQLEKDSELQKVYKNADLILADGKPLIWISNYYKTPIKEKVSGSDLFPLLCEMAGKKGYKMFFLGAAEGVAARAATNLKKRYSNLEVAGVYSPPFGFEENEEEVEKILQMIIKSDVDILIVGLGAPKQEKFIFKYHDRLNVPISLGLGASLDFEAGNIKRAPKWMQRSGLEWFFRITQDPRRMFKRYIIDDLKIIRLVRKYKIKNEA
ncbi:WecB/TagA/CpsF family glycosyltransferase [Lactococcus lactis]|uniref:WecB/TagA/CpsF family glycosyltransferase n=1 Tax=Lactococcus lactis TaxID=1358 RepID=A0A9X4NLJ7_9LACT|nr:WecB/TagA/CpsF family glycosyltransferase [Lactococcus lactis]MDG4983281.1 WecB/TagA/CpsF family glycosyltransferase [Lactococcus lactis]